MRPTNRKNSQVMVMIFGVAAVIIILAIALGSGGGGVKVPQQARSPQDSPATVNQRVIQGLEQNNPQIVYAELSPSMRQLYSEADVISGQQQSDTIIGKVTKVELLQEPQILTEPQWNGEWAEGRLRITRGTTSKEYISRYHLENGEWWLFGTIEVP